MVIRRGAVRGARYGGRDGVIVISARAQIAGTTIKPGGIKGRTAKLVRPQKRKMEEQ